ncbi:mechanosensitive ion channel [Kordia sp. TARA_039_SRF]|nr:mechanosensitive ion channel [Kordia sp. TARA_039_SRF]
MQTENTTQASTEDANTATSWLGDFDFEQIIFDYGLKVVAALAILIIGLFIIKMIVRVSKKIMRKRGIDDTLQKFLGSLLSWTLKILLFVIVASQLGIETTSFAAIIGAAGLAIGLALQGSLSNFAGGVLIMIFKPYRIGDFIEAQGVMGTVKEIQIFTTHLNTVGNKLAILPNGAVSNGNIINYSAEEKRRVDMVFGVSYDADIKQTKDILMKLLTDNEKVLTEPAPMVAVLELADSSVNFAVRPWVKTEDYWAVFHHMQEHVKLELDAAGIEIPYPHSVEIQKEG